MAARHDMHFFGELGALCGAVPPYHWSMSEERTTCRACRRVLRAGLARGGAVPVAHGPEAALDDGPLRGAR